MRACVHECVFKAVHFVIFSKVNVWPELHMLIEHSREYVCSIGLYILNLVPYVCKKCVEDLSCYKNCIIVHMFGSHRYWQEFFRSTWEMQGSLFPQNRGTNKIKSLLCISRFAHASFNQSRFQRLCYYLKSVRS